MKNFFSINKNYLANSKGQSVITLLIFTVISIIITTAAVTVIIVNSSSNTKFQVGSDAFFVAEGGAENAYLRLLRDPLYNGETVAVGNGSATITVTRSGSAPNYSYIVVSTGTVNTYFIRKVEIRAAYGSGVLTVSSWKEI